MKLALIGYGKMGKEIEKVALERGHTIALIIDMDNPNDFVPEKLKTADVAVEFTTPSAAVKNIKKCFAASLPVVCGTTGWYDQIQMVSEECKRQHGTLFYASNFSLGMNILFHLNRVLAHIMDGLPQYDVRIEEVHHTTKLDKPSGTAISLANDLIRNIERKKKWELDTASTPESIKIEAFRRENVPGDHTIIWDSEIDTLTLSHSAKSRKGLALGAILAAEFLKDKKGIYGMQDLLQF